MSILHTQSNVSENKIRSLGPFLMKPTPSSMGFWVCFPDVPENTKVEVEIFSNTQTFPKVTFTRLNGSLYGVWLAESGDILNPDSEYCYRLFLNNNKFESELKDEDFKFKTLTNDKEKDFEFALTSCNGIEEYEKQYPDCNAWEMWERLLNETKDNSDIRMIILGGDQIYMDETFEPIQTKFSGKAPLVVREMILKVYLKYWGHISYKRLLASKPSLLMWDDHDLIDGFGSRPEQFVAESKAKAGEEYISWNNFRKELTLAFYEFQACRNPSKSKSKGPFSFSFQNGKQGFSVLDLRSERNAIKKRLLRDEHKVSIETQIDSMIDQGIDNLFLVSPVTMARMGGKIENSIGRVANYLWRLSYNLNLGSQINWKRHSFWLLCSILAYIIVQTKLYGKNGFAPSITILLFSALNLFLDKSNKVNYLSEKFTRINRFFNYFIIGSTLAYFVFFGDYEQITNLDSYKVFAINFGKEMLNGKWLLIFMVISVWAFFTKHLLSYNSKFKEFVNKGSTRYSKFPKLIQKYFPMLLKWLGPIATAFVFIDLAWTGMPVKHPSAFTMVTLLPMLYLQILGTVFFVMALLEANGVIDLISGLDDDIKDAWSSATNEKELLWLSKLIEKIQRKGVRVFFLTGDIHTGGLSKVTLTDTFKDASKTIFQIVSSPISYPPMEAMVEKLTSESKKSVIELKGIRISSYNLFYRCQRNFVILKASNGALETSYHFEDVECPERFIL